MTAQALINSTAANGALQCSRCCQQQRPRLAHPRARQLQVSASAFGALSSDGLGLSGGSSTGSLLSQAASVVGIGLAAWFAARYVDVVRAQKLPLLTPLITPHQPWSLQALG